MIKIDDEMINDGRMMAGLSAVERYTALSMEKMRAYDLRDRINDFFTEQKKVIVLNTVKNEESYILEWVAYHRVMGVDGFLIMDNDSTDSTPDILSALTRAGIVCGVPWPTVHPYEKQQMSAFATAVRALQTINACEWLGFLDVDEFYVSREFGTFQNMLNNLDPADAYHLTWLFFGSSGLEKWEDGLVIERFQQRAKINHGKNWQSKPLAKLDTIAGHFHHPHNIKLVEGSTYKLPNGVDFPGVLPARTAPTGPEISRAKIRSAPLMCIHHYAIRSHEEFFEKIGKGRVNYRLTEDKINLDNHEAYFKSLDLNDEHDSVLADMADEVKQEMARITEVAGLSHILPKR